MTDLSLEVEAQDSPIFQPPDNSRIEFTHGGTVHAFWSSSFAAEANGYSPEERWRGYGRNAAWMTWADMVKDFGTSLRSLVLLKPYFPPAPLELTPVEQAAAARSEHMSHCHEEACVKCMRELRVIRRIVKAIRPHIAEQARADERRKVVAELVETLEGVYVGDPEISLYTAGKSDGYLEAAGTVRHHYDASDGPPVAAASIPTPIPDGEER